MIVMTKPDDQAITGQVWPGAEGSGQVNPRAWHEGVRTGMCNARYQL